MSQRASAGHRRGRPAWPRCVAANARGPRSPRGSRPVDAMPAAASASRSASVSASAAMMPPAARRSAAARAARPPRTLLERQVAHGPRGAAAQDVGDDRGVARDTRGRARSPRCGRGRPSDAQHAAGDGAALGGEARAHERRRRAPSRSRRASISAVTGPRSVESIFLKTNPARIRARRSRATARTRAACLGRRERPALGVDDRDRAGAIDARRVHEHADPAAPEKCAPASQAPVRSSAMSVMVMRRAHEASTGRPGCVKRRSPYTPRRDIPPRRARALRRAPARAAGAGDAGDPAAALSLMSPKPVKPAKDFRVERARQSPAQPRRLQGQGRLPELLGDLVQALRGGDAGRWSGSTGSTRTRGWWSSRSRRTPTAPTPSPPS